MDPRERLVKGQQAALEGRHAEALREYEWFHRNALKHRPSLYGVRLSFALWYWIELGKVYPEALRSLKRIRRHKMAALRNGRGNCDTFHDVVSINEHLGKEIDTARLFSRMAAKRPRMAAQCGRLALPALVQASNFKLAVRHMPDPEDRVASHAAMLNRDIPKIPGRMRRTGTKAPIKQAYVANYCDEVILLAKVLSGVGERSRAARLRKAAAASIKIPSIRRLVTERLRR